MARQRHKPGAECRFDRTAEQLLPSVVPVWPSYRRSAVFSPATRPVTPDAPQSLKARPFEFMYAAEFQPTSAEKPVSIAGQRTLRLDGSKSNLEPKTGYEGIDAKLVSLRNTLRLEPQIFERDLDDLLAVLVPLSNLMGQSVQDNKFPSAIEEKEFQRVVREWLRQQGTIGSQLEEHPCSTGGQTDLSFRGIRIELKSEPTKLLPEDCLQYAPQAASYAVGTHRRVAILCVLDCSPKKDVPFPIEDGLLLRSRHSRDLADFRRLLSDLRKYGETKLVIASAT